MLICLVWFKLWFVMLPVCIHFEVLVFPVKMMNRWDYFRNCELYLTRFWHFGAFSLPVSLSPVETFTQSHSLRIYMNLLIKIQHLNRNMKMVHTISQQIIQRYSHEFAESWVTDSQNYHDLRFFKVEFSLEQNSILSSKWKRMKYIFELHSKHLKFIIKILIKQIGAVKKMVVNQLKKIAKFIWRNSCSIVRWWLALNTNNRPGSWVK